MEERWINEMLRETALVGFVLGCICLSNAITQESLEDEDSQQTKRGYRFHNPVPATPHSPWLSGPNEKKYSFHLGQQSWVAAREICLTNNADLATISSEEELEWILSHYKPQLRHSKDRQIQIGLYAEIEENEPMREWKWVTGEAVNSSVLSWASGEPFDHANGKERCGLLNINSKTLDDVDCELGGSPLRFYRFICERTFNQHLKHEELNNPMWKKLEDILVFFGISDRTKAKNSNSTDSNESLKATPLEDEDYDEKKDLKKVNTTEIKEESKVERATVRLDEKSLKDEKIVEDKDKKLQKAHSHAFAAKIVETAPTRDDSDLLVITNLEPLRDAGKFDVVTESNVRTTRPDPLAHLADTLEQAVESDAPGDDDAKMKNLERIINAVQKMVGDDDKDKPQEQTTKTPVEKIQYVESKQKTEIEQNAVEATERLNPTEQFQIALSLDEDFKQAQKEQQAHLGVNSGDLLIIPKSSEEVVGCGAKNLKKESTISTTPSPAQIEERNLKINAFLNNLRDLLNGSDSTVLSNLFEANYTDSAENLADKLERASQLARTTQSVPPSPEELERLRKNIEKDVLKSIEELGETEDREFKSMEVTGKDLEPIGSGLEPPTEKLISLTPVALTAHQQIVVEKKTESPEEANVSGYTPKTTMELAKERKTKKFFVLSSAEAAENAAETEGFLAKSEEERPVKIETSTKLTSTSIIPESEEDSAEVIEGSGETPLVAKINEQKEQAKKQKKPRQSLFPDLDFSLLNNKKLAKEAAESSQKQKAQADEAYEALAKLDQNSLAARIAASEAQRKKTEQKADEVKDTIKVKKIQVQPALMKNKKPEDVAKQLEKMFYDWSNGAFGVFNG